jgi:hypothetical protein
LFGRAVLLHCRDQGAVRDPQAEEEEARQEELEPKFDQNKGGSGFSFSSHLPYIESRTTASLNAFSIGLREAHKFGLRDGWASLVIHKL